MNSQCEACEIFSQCLAACKSSWLFIELCKKQIYIVEELGGWGMPFSQLYTSTTDSGAGTTLVLCQKPHPIDKNKSAYQKLRLPFHDAWRHSSQWWRHERQHNHNSAVVCGRLAVDGGNALLCWRDRRECERGGGETRKQRRRRQLKSEQWADGGRK